VAVRLHPLARKSEDRLAPRGIQITFIGSQEPIHSALLQASRERVPIGTRLIRRPIAHDAGADEHRGGNPVGVAERERGRCVRSHRVAREDGPPLPHPAVENLREVSRQLFVVVPIRRRL
jgi:hypothetical protein